MNATLAEVLYKTGQLFRFDPSSPMIFSSGLFLVVFTLFVLIYGGLRKMQMARVIYVICFSLFFYYKSSGLFVLLLLAMGTSDFFIARAIGCARKKGAKLWWVTLSVLVNIGTLVWFKYAGLFAAVINGFAGGNWLDFSNIFLPIGLSFYVFQSLSYTIDIYRGQLTPLKNWLEYIFYLSFFVQILAGPIIRARDFIPQIKQKPVMVTREMFGMAIFMIICGLFKKAIISDYISLNFVDRIFDQPTLYSGGENLLGVYGYALQIYCDFSGYSDMAIGIAMLLGFHYKPNFDSPYKSATITEFWRRWHISLSSWLRDYLYISLGGNRKGKVRTYFNLIITMVLGGMWHGATLRFVLWGALHGVSLAGHKAMMAIFPGLKPAGEKMTRAGRIFGIFITFNIVCLGWIFFRAKDMQTGIDVLSQIFTNFNPALLPQVVTGYATIVGLMVLGYVLHFLPAKWEEWTRRLSARTAWPALALTLTATVWLVMQVKSSGIQPFIYFQF